MVKEFDKAGIPTVHLVNMVPVAEDVGSGRIVQTVSIPHPFGNPALTEDKQYEIRRALVKKALNALTDETKKQKIYS